MENQRWSESNDAHKDFHVEEINDVMEIEAVGV